MYALLYLPMSLYSAKYGLLIGISQYNTQQTSWGNINGENDIKLLSPILEKLDYDLSILTGKHATAKNIRDALNDLANKSQTGDTVYLHFSCHGQPVEDTNGDEKDGWDESLIPIDAEMLYRKGIYEGDNHITDDELEQTIALLRHKLGYNGCIYIAIDACHAGTAARNENIHEEFTPYRGTHIGFSQNKIYRPKHADEESYITIADVDNVSANVIVLEACLATQRNQEVRIQETLYGALSYTLATIITQYGLQCNRQWLMKVSEQMKAILPQWSTQQMVIETSLR